MDELSQTIFGKREIIFAYEEGREAIIHEAEQRLFGRNFAPMDYAEVTAALDASVISVDYNPQTDHIVVDVENDFYEVCSRELFVEDGKKTIENVLLQVRRPPAPQGVGARMVAR